MSAVRVALLNAVTLLSAQLAVAAPATLTPVVSADYPHDSEAFTQGLLWHEGALYESTGLYGSSTLRQVELESGDVLRQVTLPDSFFAEGLAVAPNVFGEPGWHLIQLTWREQIAFVYELESLTIVTTFAFDGEGWGLCWDGLRLVMSDGTATLSFRDAASFEVTGTLEVTNDGDPVTRLNELECNSEEILANVWQTDRILMIDPSDGAVTAVIDAAGLLSESEAAAADVLNGIAVAPDHGDLLVTGKQWPKLFEIELEAAGGGEDDPPAGGCTAAAPHHAGGLSAMALLATALLRRRFRSTLAKRRRRG